jgi:hypothetical protein
MSMSKIFPGLPRNEISKPDLDAWKALMQAALRVHRYHAANATNATSGQPSEHAAEEHIAEATSAQPTRTNGG